MSNRKTRDRQLAKLHARRDAERRRKRRQRTWTLGIASVLSVGLVILLLVLFLGNDKTPAASPSATPTPTASASAAGVACGGTVPKAASVKKKSYKKPPPFTIDKAKTYIATMQTSCGTIEVQLDPKEAPNTVNSLVFLIKQGFFDGTIFHRTVANFVIQGGDPTGSGGGGPGYQTVDVPPKGAQYVKGDMAMAKTQTEPPGTAGSQFFVVTGDPAALNQTHDYALVGKVAKGMEIALKIGQLPRTGGATDGAPDQTVYIVKMTVREA